MQADGGTVGVGAPAAAAVVVVVLQNGCVCSYWDDDITLCVWSRLWAKSGPAGLAARQINCWTLREGWGWAWVGMGVGVGGSVGLRGWRSV